jgi:molybdopterin/thiamine biosynthesis adenylyltransferase
MSIDPLRHLDVFKPHAFGNKRVDVIGCGATGSRVVLSLAKLGIENIHVWDYDIVEPHNIANQVFGLSNIGQLKVQAMSEIVKSQTGVDIHIHNEKVDGTQRFGDYVFLLVDTMSARKEIFEKSLKYKTSTKLMIETRMGADSGRAYVINPIKSQHIKGWENTWYPDTDVEVSACGASISVGPTAEIISGLAVWQLVRSVAIDNGYDDVLDNEIIISLRSMMVMSSKFS